MNWAALVGPACLVVSLLVALYVRDKAREVVREEFATLITASLAQFKNDLIESLDKVYVRTTLCDVMRDSQADRIDIAAKRLDSIDARFDNLKPNSRREH